VVAIESLSQSVENTVRSHDVGAADELMEVRFACNRASRKIDEAAEAAGGK